MVEKDDVSEKSLVWQYVSFLKKTNSMSSPCLWIHGSRDARRSVCSSVSPDGITVPYYLNREADDGVNEHGSGETVV